MKKAILGTFSILLPILVIDSVMLLPKSQLQDTSSESLGSPNVRDYTIVHIGEGNNLSTQVINKIVELGAQVTISNELLESMELNDSLIVMFDTEWIQEKIDDTRFHDFLRNAAPKEVKLVAIGGNTSKFFEALDKAGVYELPVTETGEIRNPAYNNPPLVGFRMKKAYTSKGHEYLYPSMKFGFTANNIDEIVQGIIITW